MWISSRLEQIRNHDGSILLIGTDALGIPHLISGHPKETSLIWLELEAADVKRPVQRRCKSLRRC